MPRTRPGQLKKGQYGGVELVLTKRVTGLGKAGEVVEVKAGYARNYLLPHGLAIRATPHNLKLIEQNKIKVAKQVQVRREELEKLARDLSKHSLSIEATANEDGHLYGSVAADEICTALAKDRLSIESEMVRLEGPIKELGLYSVKLQLAEEISTELKVWVVPATGSSK